MTSALSTTTGIPAVRGSARKRRRISSPDMSGRRRSRSTRLGWCSLANSKASPPSMATMTVTSGRRARIRSRSLTLDTLSSTHNTVRAVAGAELSTGVGSLGASRSAGVRLRSTPPRTCCPGLVGPDGGYVAPPLPPAKGHVTSVAPSWPFHPHGLFPLGPPGPTTSPGRGSRIGCCASPGR